MLEKHGLIVPVAAARLYLQRGWRIVPIPPRQKSPRLSGWQNLRLTEDELELYLTRDSNVGILLGAPSGGLCDVDLDAPLARAVAPELLPPTGMVHGRASAPRSHYWYHCLMLAESRFQYNDPELTTEGGKPVLLLEIRSTGHQTVVPPSVHPSGEQLVWHTDTLEPATVDADALKRACARVAAAAVLAARWREGVRNDLSLALAGYLARCGWTEDDAVRFTGAVCAAANDREWRNRLEAVRATFRKVAQGEPCTGLPTLTELLGERVAERLSGWLAGRFEFSNEQRKRGVLIAAEPLFSAPQRTTETRPINSRGTVVESAPEPDADAEPPAVVDLADVPPTPTRWLVEGLVPEGFTTNFYGIGGAGKSLLALRLALSLLQGRPFLGHAVHRRAKCVLYLDFEFDAERHAERWHAVARGAGLSQPPRGLLYLRARTDFFTLTKDLFKLVAHYKPDLIIVDSLGRAVIDPLDVKRIMAFYNTLDALDSTVLCVDHPPKPTAELSEEHGTEYGNAYKRYAARSVLQVVRGEAQGNELGVRIRHVKANLDTYYPEIDVRLVFYKSEGLLERVEFYWGCDALAKPELFGRKGEVLQHLLEVGASTVSEVSKALGIPESTTRETLLKLERAGLVVGEGYRPRKYRPAEGGTSNNGSTAINTPRNRCSTPADDPALEALLQQLQADAFAPLAEDEAHAVRQLWQAASAHGFPRLQLPDLLILPGEPAWLEALRLLAGTPQAGLALRLLSDLPPSNGGGIQPPDANGAGDSPSSPTDGVMKEELL